MKTESTSEILDRDILLLEQRQSEQFKNLKEQLHAVHESLKPINLIKNTVMGAIQSPDLKSGIGKATIGMVSGYLLKRIVFGSSTNLLKRFSGLAFQTLAANLVAKNSDKIKNTGINIFEMVKALILRR